jgi:imidazolonepropionase-like amidohydrolase
MDPTREAARLLGREHELGTVDVGKLADLVAVPADPLEDVMALQRVGFAMKEGEIRTQQSSRTFRSFSRSFGQVS